MLILHLLLVWQALAACRVNDLTDWADNDLTFTWCSDGSLYGYTNRTKDDCTAFIPDNPTSDPGNCWWDTSYESRCLTPTCRWIKEHWQGQWSEGMDEGACYCREYNPAEASGQTCPDCQGVTPAPTYDPNMSSCTPDCLIWETGCGAEYCHCNRADELCVPSCTDPNGPGQCLIWAPTPLPTADPTPSPVSDPTFAPTFAIYWMVRMSPLTEAELLGANQGISTGLRLFSLDGQPVNDENNRVKLLGYRIAGTDRRRQTDETFQAEYKILLDSEQDATDKIQFINDNPNAVKDELAFSSPSIVLTEFTTLSLGRNPSTPATTTGAPTTTEPATTTEEPTTTQPPTTTTSDPATTGNPVQSPTEKPVGVDAKEGGGGGGGMGMIIAILAVVVICGIVGLFWWKKDLRAKACPCFSTAEVRKEPEWEMATTKDFERGRELDRMDTRNTVGETNTAGEGEVPTPEPIQPGFVTSAGRPDPTPGFVTPRNNQVAGTPGMPAPPPPPGGSEFKPGMGPRGTSMDALGVTQPVYVGESGGETDGEEAPRHGESVVEVD